MNTVTALPELLYWCCHVRGQNHLEIMSPLVMGGEGCGDGQEISLRCGP